MLYDCECDLSTTRNGDDCYLLSWGGYYDGHSEEGDAPLNWWIEHTFGGFNWETDTLKGSVDIDFPEKGVWCVVALTLGGIEVPDDYLPNWGGVR